MPYLINRPLSVQCFPNGPLGDSFYLHQLQDFPPTLMPKLEGGTGEGPIICSSPETLTALVQSRCLIFEVSASTTETLQNPDWLCIQFSVSALGSWPLLKETLLAFSQLPVFKEQDSSAFLKTSGHQQLDWVVPLSGDLDFTAALRQAFEQVEALTQLFPRRIEIQDIPPTDGFAKGKVFVSLSVNNPGRSMIAPYSLFNVESGQVSAPIALSELSLLETFPNYTVEAMAHRLETAGDLWKNLLYR